MFQFIVTKNKELSNFMDNIIPPNIVVIMCFTIGILLLLIAISRSAHGHGYKDFRRRCSMFFVALALVLSCLSSETFVLASSNTLLIDSQTFSQSIGVNSTSALVSISFNISVPPHNNGTFRFQYENMVNGVVTDKCYIKEFSVYINGRMVVTKQFSEGNVQMCDVSVPFTTLGTPGSQNGTLNIIGKSEGSRFYGTVSLMMMLNEPSSGFPLNFSGSWLDFLALSVIIVPIAVGIIVIARRRKRRRED